MYFKGQRITFVDAKKEFKSGSVLLDCPKYNCVQAIQFKPDGTNDFIVFVPYLDIIPPVNYSGE
jgi:hypothetical protein